MVGLMATSSKRTYAIPTPRAPVPAADHCRPIPPRETLKHSSVSVSVGTLGPGVHKVLFVPSKSLFPQSCVSSGSSMVGLIVTSSKRTYAILTPRAPVPEADHHRPIPPQETLKHSSVSVSVGFLGSGVHRVCLSPLSISGGNGI